MTPLLGALLLALSAPEACGLPPLAAERPFGPGERLTFDVAIMGMVQAGTLQLSVEPAILGGSQWPLRARARNTSVFAKIRRVKASGLSWVDTATLLPQRFRDEMDEDGLKKSTDVPLDRPGPILSMAWARGDQRGRTEFRRQGPAALDLLSAIYFLRAAELQPGASFCFDLFGNWRLWRLSGTVAARRETVESPAGSFETLRLDARLVRADDPARSRPLHLWISTDRRRLLVAAVSEVDLGPVHATLVRASE